MPRRLRRRAGPCLPGATTLCGLAVCLLYLLTCSRTEALPGPLALAEVPASAAETGETKTSDHDTDPHNSRTSESGSPDVANEDDHPSQQHPQQGQLAAPSASPAKHGGLEPTKVHTTEEKHHQVQPEQQQLRQQHQQEQQQQQKEQHNHRHRAGLRTEATELSRVDEEVSGQGLLILLVVGLLAIVRGVLAVWMGEQEGLRAVRLFQRAWRVVVHHASAGLEVANQARLVHVQGLTATGEALRDSLFGVEVKDTLKLRRKVEMFQWTEHAEVSVRDIPGGGKEQATVYSYKAGWHHVPVESWRFQGNQGPRHANPKMPLISEELWAKEATLGKFRLPSQLVGQVSRYVPCTEIAPATMELPVDNKRVQFSQATVEGIPYLVSSDAASPPEIGDLRVRFERAPCEEVSVLAVQADDTFRPFKSTDRIDTDGRVCFNQEAQVQPCGLLDLVCCLPRSHAGTPAGQREELFLISHGRRSAKQMLRAAEALMPRPRSWPNLSGSICIVLGMGILGSIVPGLFQVLPYAGTLVGSFGLPAVWLTALFVGGVIGHCVAALAWFQARPYRALLWIAAAGLLGSVPYLYRSQLR